MIAVLEGDKPEACYSPRQYALGQSHKHQPEMQKICGLDYKPVFNPIVDDYYNGFPDVKGVAAQVDKEDFVIFAGHTPDFLPDALKAADRNGDGHWFDLALFGHTHGGQINLFGYTPFKNVDESLSARYMTGWHEENRAGILISNGVGTSVLPVRLFAQPQIHLITLKAR